MALANGKIGRVGMFLANPMVRKLDKVEETGEKPSTTKGIARKTVFFLLLTLVGLGVFFLVSPMVPTTYMENINGIEVNVIEAVICVVLVILAALAPLFAFKFVKGSFVFGSIYSLAQGYVLAFAFHLFGTQYVYPCLIALGLTILLVFAMLFLYRTKLVRIDSKFVSVIATVITMSVLAGIVVAIMNCIPATQEYAQFVMSNIGIVAISGIVAIAIATLFLLVDFEVINHCVEEQLDKKYEWLAAFALSFSIIELYLKILNFIIRMAGNSNQAQN